MKFRPVLQRGVSSPVALRAHNPKGEGSNPTLSVYAEGAAPKKSTWSRAIEDSNLTPCMPCRCSTG
ncbi:hypothetical protein [Synechococcus sp. MIT S1220]|uniref:hypothetical protein n=1 Tax=Synechococcus sp. MIT S1220 TaxID=3082549 RepID=UPI0039B0B965